MRTKPEQSRVSVNLPKEFHRRVKSYAALRGKTMQALVMEALGRSMEEHSDEPCKHSHEPNERLEKILKNIDEGKNLIEYENIDDLFKDLRE